MQSSETILNENVFARGVRLLADRDAHLAEVVRKYGPPPLWVREAGFPTIVYIILEQQVSLASAKAAFDRLPRDLQARAGPSETQSLKRAFSAASSACSDARVFNNDSSLVP